MNEPKFVTCEECRQHRDRVWGKIDKNTSDIAEAKTTEAVLKEKLESIENGLNKVSKGIWWIVATVGGVLLTAVLNLILNV